MAQFLKVNVGKRIIYIAVRELKEIEIDGTMAKITIEGRTIKTQATASIEAQMEALTVIGKRFEHQV